MAIAAAAVSSRRETVAAPLRVNAATAERSATTTPPAIGSAFGGMERASSVATVGAGGKIGACDDGSARIRMSETLYAPPVEVSVNVTDSSSPDG